MTTATEDKNGYYYVNGKCIQLVLEPSVYAVKFATGERSDSTSLSYVSRRLLREDSENICFIPNYGLQVYRVIPQVTKTIEEKQQYITQLVNTVHRLNKESAIQYATPAYRCTPNSSELMYATKFFSVQFKLNITKQQINEFNAQNGVVCVKELGYCDNGYLLQATEGGGGHSAVALANTYFESGLCIFATPDFVRKIHYRHTSVKPYVYELAQEFNITNEEALKLLHELHVDVKSYMSSVDSEVKQALQQRLALRDIPSSIIKDDRGGCAQYLNQQWHLKIAKVIDAWNEFTKGDSSIKICIMDDGIDVDHTEFTGKVIRQYDFYAHLDNARPKNPDDNHGTACAGVAVALGKSASGSAPGCSLIAIRTPSYLGSADEAQMFKSAADWGADIISCSWGPSDGTGATDPLPDTTRAAINYCINYGRNKKGIPIFWAAGNGNESVSLDGYASNPEVIAVSASTSNESRSWYSDYGPEVWVCAPSSGNSSLGEKRIFTVDRTGNAGYNAGDIELGDVVGNYTNNFGGTSSAAPLVAGIAGLILSVNSNLTHQQVRDILKNTACKIGSIESYDANSHSNEYGYGRVDALEALRKAKSYTEDSSTTISSPSIIGPSSYERTAEPPQFQVITGNSKYYAVEVAINPDYFDLSGQHDAERKDETKFYASWIDTDLMSASIYALPYKVWDKLKAADRLYYRIITSKNQSDWEDMEMSTTDSQSASAPSIQINGEATTTSPILIGGISIIGPSSHERTAEPPQFQVITGNNKYYAVEFAINPDYFDLSGQHEVERKDETKFYASWMDTALISTSIYTLPYTVWDKLKSANSLYYRIITSKSQSNWVDMELSTPDNQASMAPSITLTGIVSRIVLEPKAIKRQFIRPWIVGPERYDRGAVAPAFNITLGDNHFYAIEVTTDENLFLDHTQRNAGNFFTSLQDGAIEADRETVYTLPTDVWNNLCNASRLFYRVLTTNTSTNWSNYVCSTPDDQYDSSPYINLFGGKVSKFEIISRDVKLPGYDQTHVMDDLLWRNK